MIYIAGPMTGIPQSNFPAFHRAAKRLRDSGLLVVNPAEIEYGDGAPWDRCLRGDIIEMCDKCDAIYLLLGWHKSKGATLEYHIAQQLGMRIEFETP